MVHIQVAQRLLINMAMEKLHIPIMFIGGMGVGKSWSVRDAAQYVNKKLIKKMGDDYNKDMGKLFWCIDLRLATQEPGDITGIPYEKDGIQFWSKPCWWPKDGTRGILFLDELNRAPIDVRQAVFQLVTEWRLHTHELPEGWIIVSAINPDNSEYQVETLDKAMLRRFCQIETTPDTREWLRWADNYGIDASIQKFIRENQELLYTKENFSIHAFPNPEGYRMVDEMLEMDVIPNDDEARFEIIAGLIGAEAATELSQYLDKKIESCFSAEDILDRYDDIRDQVQTQSHDRMNKTIEEFVVRYEKTGVPKDHRQLTNFAEFVKDLTPEFKTTLVMSIADNDELILKLGKDRELKQQLMAIRKNANDEED